MFMFEHRVALKSVWTHTGEIQTNIKFEIQTNIEFLFMDGYKFAGAKLAKVQVVHDSINYLGFTIRKKSKNMISEKIDHS